jgi:hypothetical protein
VDIEMIFIGCRGGDPDAPGILKNAGWYYGSRSDYVIYEKPVFIDINWENYNWLKHWLVVRRWKPKIAMVADYLHPKQKETMLRQVSQIRRLGVRPMVCPKFSDAVADIPADCIVAVSVPTKYAGFLPIQEEVKDRELHLLGGHPDQFAILMRLYNQSKIISVDCSAIFQKAQFGAHWEPTKNDWLYVEKNSKTTHELTELSALKVAEYLSNPPKAKKWNNKRSRSILQLSFTAT